MTSSTPSKTVGSGLVPVSPRKIDLDRFRSRPGDSHKRVGLQYFLITPQKLLAEIHHRGIVPINYEKVFGAD